MKIQRIKVGFKLIGQTKSNSSAFHREWLQSNKLSNIHLALIRRQVELKRAAGRSRPQQAGGGGAGKPTQMRQNWIMRTKVVCSFLKSFLEKKPDSKPNKLRHRQKNKANVSNVWEADQRLHCETAFCDTIGVAVIQKLVCFFFDLGKLNPNPDSVSYLCDVKERFQLSFLKPCSSRHAQTLPPDIKTGTQSQWSQEVNDTRLLKNVKRPTS